MISANRNLTPGVDNTLLSTHFSIVTDAVGALTFPVKSNKLTPMIIWFFLSLVCFLAHYLSVCDLFYFGTCVFGINIIVFVPFVVLIPWDKCLSSFENECSQFFLSGPLTRCLYSWATPDMGWVNVLASITCRVFSANE